MDSRYSWIGLLLLLLSIGSVMVKSYYSSAKNDLKTYIVYTGSNRHNETYSLFLYQNMLQQVADSKSIPKHIIHHYKRSFGGFAAQLTEDEAHRMAGLDGVVSAFPNKKLHLLTTKSWDFIGFPQYVQHNYSESNVIIGVIDSGIWPESESFNDKGFSPPPSKWKGICEINNFTCNNKIIGARSYTSSDISDILYNVYDKSARDSGGHGTHVASIAAGNPVNQASMLGFGKGTSRGGASSARIAVYKVCRSTTTCDTSKIIQAFDDAIADGVDILSVSLGGAREDYSSIYDDQLSIGSFHAMKHGVLTVFSAGNIGPDPASLQNFAPWSIVVGAGTFDRKLVTKVKLGNNKIYESTSGINTFDLKGKMYPIIYGKDAPNKELGFDANKSRCCATNSLDRKLVKGKIVLCDEDYGSEEALRAGAVGVLVHGASVDIVLNFPLPGCYLRSEDASSIRKYIHSERSPRATIFKTDEVENSLAPMVASFSSRGPNIVTPDILKPDIIAPGTGILASWSPIAPPSEDVGDTRKLKFNIVSGTSMACPHVSGAAGYIKSVHPKWSPAAIRSALMTTAKQMSAISLNNHHAEFAYGAGQVDPVKALNPGLLYDAEESDYVRLLCGQGYNITILQQITGDNSNCSNITYASARDLNYPSFAIKASHPKHYIRGSFKRTVTNVGLSTSSYKAIVSVPNGLNISVEPNVLTFTSIGEKQIFVLTIEGILKESIGSGSLIWNDGKYQVRSPIVIYDERIEKTATSGGLTVGQIFAIVGLLLSVFVIFVIIKYL